MDLLGGAGEVRVDLEAVHIADDHQRRVLQGLAVELKLLVGRLEVLVLALVLPAEMVPHPNVGPAFLVFAGLHAFLEGVPRAFRVDIGRLGLVQQFADVEKVLLAGTAFGERDALPFGDELLRGQSGRSASAAGRIIVVRRIIPRRAVACNSATAPTGQISARRSFFVPQPAKISAILPLPAWNFINVGWASARLRAEFDRVQDGLKSILRDQF